MTSLRIVIVIACLSFALLAQAQQPALQQQLEQLDMRFNQLSIAYGQCLVEKSLQWQSLKDTQQQLKQAQERVDKAPKAEAVTPEKKK